MKTILRRWTLVTQFVIARSPAKRDDEAIQLDRDKCVSLGGRGALRAPRDDKAYCFTIARIGTLLLGIATAGLSQTQPAPAPIKPIAEFFRLDAVTLTPGPFADAMAGNAAYLVQLDPDRLLSGYRSNAGLEPKAPKYGGWEARGLAGHTLGHYLTALAWMVEATGDARYREKLDYTISELALCQTEARGGLISAIPDDAKVFAEVARGDIRPQRFDLNGGWVPWYNLHKLFAGLHDAHVHGGSAPALAVLRRFADWAERTTSGLTDEQFQRMLYAEHGGMNEVLADLYALTNEPRYLKLAQRFCDREVLAPLSRGEDKLNGFHANTQIPKLIGAARLHQLTGDAALGKAAETFWSVVVRDRSWVTGGNSEAEHFFPPDQNLRRLTHSTAETCNTYNMLRLTEQLYALHPDASRFDYYERALYNHILASIDPRTGRCTYFVSLRPGFFKYYGHAENAFWCCTGTGLENHAKYARGIYAHAGDDVLFVNLFIPSTLTWKSRGVRLEQRTRFPEQAGTEFVVHTAHPTKFALKLRLPRWVASPSELRVNRVVETIAPSADGYLTLEREWRDGDTVSLTLPMQLHMEALPRTENTLAILYGPLVLAGQLGRGGLEKIDLYPPGENQYRGYVPAPAPVIVAEENEILKRLEPVPGRALTWRTRDLVRPGDVTLIPFHTLHHERHVVYWTRLSPAAWPAEEKRRAEINAREQALAARTLDEIVCGEQQLEVNHAFRGERTEVGFVYAGATRWARADGWFEYRLAVDPEKPVEVLCTWWGSDAGRVAELSVDGQVLGTQKVERDAPEAAFSSTHVLPTELTRGKSQVVLRVRGIEGKRTGQLLSVRVLRPN
jgi:DUF1680 family protein